MGQDHKCSICNSSLDYYRKENYYRCPVCFTEVWPDEERLKQIEQERKRRETAEQDRQRSLSRVGWDSRIEPLPAGVPIFKGRSNKNKKRKNKQNKGVVNKWEGI